MALPNLLRAVQYGRNQRAILRVAQPEFSQLKELVFRRYPKWEWATFARFGWRETPGGLVVTLARLDPPQPGDLDERVGHVAIDEKYSLRMALAAEKHLLAVGIVHSHPREGAPSPSAIDDDMDSYYSRYFADFAPGRPYISLIISIVDSRLSLSGRIFWRGRWLSVDSTAAESDFPDTWPRGQPPTPLMVQKGRAARFVGAFGDEALKRLRASSVAVVGAGGTGSAVIEVLARAGVGRLILVDPDIVDESNLERIHGSTPSHVETPHAKVLAARDHVKSIDSSIHVESYIGRLPQKEIIDALVSADIAVGCTDQQHSRLALSDLAFRYLLPAIDSGVILEGKDGRVTGQVAQFVRFFAADPCALCRGMIDPVRVGRELMSEAERSARRAAAQEAERRGDNRNAYWEDLPQINTVGYLTTTAGGMAAGYVIGLLTGRFDPPFERMQMNFVAPYLDVTDLAQKQRAHCPCANYRGWADQANADALVSAPDHWPPVQKL